MAVDEGPTRGLGAYVENADERNVPDTSIAPLQVAAAAYAPTALPPVPATSLVHVDPAAIEWILEGVTRAADDEHNFFFERHRSCAESR